MTVDIIVRDYANPEYDKLASNRSKGDFPTRTFTRKGFLYEIEGKPVELFRIKTMAEALGRTIAWVRRSEREGSFPKPLFQVSTQPRRGLAPESVDRWYSATQILNINRLLFYKYKFCKNRRLAKEQFSKDIRRVFYATKIIVSVSGEIFDKPLKVQP